MPTYEYLCQNCGQRLEVFQKFSAKSLRVHDECGGALQKVFHASGVVFKGSGYYVTDSRAGGSAAASAGNGKPDSSKGASKDTDSKKSESKELASKKADSPKSGAAKTSSPDTAAAAG
jgi:putative FmdB family regulatory protein